MLTFSLVADLSLHPFFIIVGFLIAEEGGANVHSKQADNSTPLLLAAYNGHWAAVKSLIAAGSGTEGRGAGHRGAVHVAALAGHIEVLDELMHNGADVNIQVNISELM